MTRLSTVLLPLALVAVLSGCGGNAPQAQVPSSAGAEPVGPVRPSGLDETRGQEADQALQAETEPNDVETVAAERAEGDEPDVPVPAEMPQSDAAEPMPALEKPAEPELNQPIVSTPPVSMDDAPDEPVTTEEPSKPTAADEPTPEAMAPFYRGYADLLQQHVRADGGVDYESLRRRRLMLRQLLAWADELDPNVYRQWSRDEQLGFWIDVCNLKMLEIIARNYPIESSWWLRLTWPPSDIRHIDGIWSDYRFIVMEEEFTLGAVERRFLSKTFGDPRAFLAITYASRSGPPLRRVPYRGEALDRQLDEQVRAFLTSDKGLRIDRAKGVVYLSALFKPTWRGKEFVARYGTDKKFKDRPPETRAVLSFVTRYLGPDDAYFLEVENYALEYMNFDWRLNDASRGR